MKAYTLAEVQAMTPLELDGFRHKIQTDVRFAMERVWGYEFQPLHKKIAAVFTERLSINGANPETISRFTHICGFRNCGKTHTEACAIACEILGDKEGDERILISSGTVPKAAEILELVNQHLSHPIIQFAFPEFKGQVVKHGWKSPLRANTSNLKEPTICTGSPRSVKAGWHFSRIYADDLMTEQIKTAFAVEDSKQRFDDLMPLLEPDGFLIHVCTRISAYDIVGQALEKGRDLILQIPIYTVRAGVAKRQADLCESDVALAWASKFSWSLIQNYMQDARVFASQYLLTPLPEQDEVHFDEAAIRARVMDVAKVALQMRTCQFVVTIDGAGFNDGDDWGIVSALWDRNTRTHFFTGFQAIQFANSDEVAEKIVKMYLNCLRSPSPFEPIFHIENAHSVKGYLDSQLQALAKKRGLKNGIPIMWEPSTNSDGARNDRLRLLAERIATDREWFSNEQDCGLEIFIKQAVAYSVHKVNPRDDVADSAAQNCELCPTLPPPIVKTYVPDDRYAGKPDFVSQKEWVEYVDEEREENQQQREAEAENLNQESAAEEARRWQHPYGGNP